MVNIMSTELHRPSRGSLNKVGIGELDAAGVTVNEAVLSVR